MRWAALVAVATAYGCSASGDPVCHWAGGDSDHVSSAPLTGTTAIMLGVDPNGPLALAVDGATST